MVQNVHLLICIHGLWGKPDNLAELARVVRAKYPIPSDDSGSEIELDLLVTKSNAENRTYDGVDWGAERVAEEVQAHITSMQANGTRKVSRFSVIGYSLGGLLARYLLGILHARGFFDDVKPYNFVTISTPHVGLPKYPGFLSACFNSFGPRLLSRSGKQISLLDQWSSSRRPILEIMADNDSVFFKTLSLFPRIHIYANAVNDVMVPYLTGAIELEDPFVVKNGLEIDLDEHYAPMIKTIIPPESPSRFPHPKLFSMALLRSLKPKPLLLPVPVPVQYLIWVCTPVLAPLLFVYVLVRLSLESRTSRMRIMDLERGDSSAATLINSLRAMEKHTDQAISAIVDTPPMTHRKTPGGRKSLHNSQPSLSPKQRSIVASLNSLPQMRKHLAYIDGVLNSHAVIVCRDVKNIESHKRGEGVLRHIADSLVI